jgi:hypothetical protein
MFPYAMLPHHKGAKQDTIGVAGRVNAKMPHYMSPVLAYLMENEMPFTHHVVERWGCSYTIKNDKGLNERTRRHPMLKPMSKHICRRGGSK